MIEILYEKMYVEIEFSAKWLTKLHNVSKWHAIGYLTLLISGAC